MRRFWHKLTDEKSGENGKQKSNIKGSKSTKLLFPVEVWLAIISNLPSTQDIENLSLTCKLYRQLTAPILFHTLKINERTPHKHLRSLPRAQHILSLIHTLELSWVAGSGSEQSTYQKYREFEIGQPPSLSSSGQPAFEATMTLCRPIWSGLSGLQKLEVQDMQIPVSLHLAILSSKTLKELSLLGCTDVAGSYTGNEVIPTGAGVLTAYKIESVKLLGLYEKLIKRSAATLTSVYISNFDLKQRSLLEHFINHRSTLIKTVETRVKPSVASAEEIQILLQFLAACTGITSLKVVDYDFLKGSGLTIPSGSLQQLKSLECSVSIAEVLIPGRPIERYVQRVMKDEGRVRDISKIVDILASKSGMKELGLRCKDVSLKDCLPAITSEVQVVKLSVGTCSAWKDEVAHFLQHPSIKYVEIETENIENPDTIIHETISILSTYPNSSLSTLVISYKNERNLETVECIRLDPVKAEWSLALVYGDSDRSNEPEKVFHLVDQVVSSWPEAVIHGPSGRSKRPNALKKDKDILGVLFSTMG